MPLLRPGALKVVLPLRLHSMEVFSPDPVLSLWLYSMGLYLAVADELPIWFSLVSPADFPPFGGICGGSFFIIGAASGAGGGPGGRGGGIPSAMVRTRHGSGTARLYL